MQYEKERWKPTERCKKFNWSEQFFNVDESKAESSHSSSGRKRKR